MASSNLSARVLRHQYGVGQGCFHAQELLFNDVRPHEQFAYRFVYDCGSSSSTQARDWGIGHLADALDGAPLDAAYLSHFENDHVNGLAALCGRIDVGRIYAPHLDQNTLLHLVAQQGAMGTDWSFTFETFLRTVLTIANGGDFNGVPVTLIAPGGGPPPLPPDVRPDLEPPGEPASSSSPVWTDMPTGRVAPDSRVGTINHGQRGVVWELVHWCYAAQADLTQTIVDELSAISGSSVLLQGTRAGATPAEVDAALRWIEQHFKVIAAAYKAAMRRFNREKSPSAPLPDNHNIASLCVYSGPALAQALQSMLWDYAVYPSNAGRHLQLQRLRAVHSPWRNPAAASWLATGDAMLKLPAVWTAFEAHFNLRRIRACVTVLVPHHGADARSSHNFHPGLVQAWQTCVICAGSLNIYRHPHRNVLDAILAAEAHIELVTETAPLGFVERLSYVWK